MKTIENSRKPCRNPIKTLLSAESHDNITIKSLSKPMKPFYISNVPEPVVETWCNW